MGGWKETHSQWSMKKKTWACHVQEAKHSDIVENDCASVARENLVTFEGQETVRHVKVRKEE